MLNIEQGKIVEDLIRKNARMMKAGHHRILNRINALVEAQEAQIPDSFLLPYSACLNRVLQKNNFDISMVPISVLSLFNKNQQQRKTNSSGLRIFGLRIRDEFKSHSDEAVLDELGGSLLGLYRDIGAFAVNHWAAFLANGTCVDGDRARSMKPFVYTWSEKLMLGDSAWKSPKPTLLITLLANHVGDAEVNPDPPVWHHLGLAVLLWRDSIKIAEVMDVAAKLGLKQNVERGLAIIEHIFPEISSWMSSAVLQIPKWERKFAIPLAARRIVIGGRD